MVNLKPYETYNSEIQENSEFLDQNGKTPALSEAAKHHIKKMCDDMLCKEAEDYHNDDNPEHTHEGYKNEACQYLNECLGQPGYASMVKPYAE